MKSLSLLVMLLLFCNGHTANADQSAVKQPVTATAGVDRTSVSIGDKITYTIKVRAPKDYEIRMPSFGENLADFAVKDFSSDESGFFSRTYTQSYILDIYETGTFTIPAVVIKYKGKESPEWRETAAEEISITVQSMLDETGRTAEIRGIRGPCPIRNPTYIYIALAALAIVAAALALFMFLKKKKESEKIIAPPPPAHETALRALKDLLGKDYINTGRVREYYFELSNIVRHYLEDRFNMKAPEMTTEEFLIHLKKTDKLTSDQKGLLREFLSHCDMVKFAKHLPVEREIESIYGSAKDLVEQTKESRTTGETTN